MIGDNAKTLLIQQITAQPLTTRARVFLKFDKDYKSDIPAENSDVIYTNGCYSISYKPRPKKKPFAFGMDFYPGRSVRFDSWEDIGDNIYDEFIKKYTTLTPDYFKLAKDNPGLHFYFNINYKKYEEDFAKEMGDRPHKFIPDGNYEAEQVREDLLQSNVGWGHERLCRRFEREYREERDK